MNVNGTGGNDSLDGSSGDDSINGFAGNDTLWGGAGNDTLWGWDGYDTVDYRFMTAESGVTFASGLRTAPVYGAGEQADGLGGTDSLNSIEEIHVIGSQYADSLAGNFEVDIFQGGDGDDTLTGGAGFDAFVYDIAPYSFSGIDLVTDLAGGDAFHFHDNSAALVLDTEVRGGNDAWNLERGQVMVISPGDGFTHVYLGTSSAPGSQLHIDLTGTYSVSDFIVENRSWGGVLHYGPMQTVIGANGEDRLVGTAGTDYFQGNGGNDTLIGNGGNDTLDGGGDHDAISGGSGNDLLAGGDGDDRIGAGGQGEEGDDTVDGGAGWDTAVFDFRQSSSDIVFTSSGTGTATRNQADPLGATDTLQNIEQVDVYGGAGNDLLTGDMGWNSLSGGDGNDTLAGLGGPDVYSVRYAAGTGIDRIVGFDTQDIIRIEDETGNVLRQDGPTLAGDDASALGRAQIMVGSAQEGVTRIYVGTDSVAGADLMFDLEGAYLPGELWTQDRLRIVEDGRFLRSIELSYAPPQNQTGSDGPDALFGAAGADLLDGRGGNDTLIGGDRADTLHGGEGHDLLLGGRGNDLVYGDAGDDIFGDDMDFDDVGSDTLDGGAGYDAVAYDYSHFAGGFELVSSGSGPAPRTQSMPNQGVDTLIGIEEVRIHGSQGADTISGDAGRNWIEGDRSNDIPTGGGGDDRFSYDWTISSGIDRITDFGSGDELWFYRFSGATAGLSETIQTGTASSSLGSGQVMVGTISSGVTRISVGTNNVGGPDLRIDLQGSFTAADFLVVNTSAGAALRLVTQAVVTGTDGPDVLQGGPGSDLIEGRGGYDIAVYQSSRGSHPVTVEPGRLTLGDGASTDVLTDIERIDFDDGSLYFHQGRAFDPLRYTASHADLVHAFRDDADLAAQHYFYNGEAEGRVVDFDAMRYLASYGDLIQAFGTDTAAATLHYIRNGLDEGRVIGFDAARYLASNPDVLAAYGPDDASAARHYVQYGFHEGRSFDFDALRYVASYEDLIQAFGTNVDAATAHFVDYGFAEGRESGFDPLQYALGNGDLLAAFGFDAPALESHYIRWGHAEGRVLTLATQDGTAGGDVLAGTDAAGFLRGLAGNDTLSGGNGNDLLTGGAGADTLAGGAGMDVFAYFAADEGGDSITDFHPGTDKIAFDADAFGGGPAGPLDAGRFAASSQALGQHAGFVYDASSGSLGYDADGSGAAAAVEIVLVGSPQPLAASDILMLG